MDVEEDKINSMEIDKRPPLHLVRANKRIWRWPTVVVTVLLFLFLV